MEEENAHQAQEENHNLPPGPGPECFKSATHEDFVCLLPDGKFSHQEYTVKTEDGYFLKLLRFQKKLESADQKFDPQRHPVVLLPGLTSDGVGTFLTNSPSLAIGVILADNNFDVWLGNNRGCRFCREHETLDPREAEFWNYSFDQMAEFDLPSILKLVFEETQKKSVVYGYSQGATQTILALSDSKIRPKVLPYINSLLGYGPALFANHPNREFEKDFKASIEGMEAQGVPYFMIGSGVWDSDKAKVESEDLPEHVIDFLYQRFKAYNFNKNFLNWKRAFILKALGVSGTSKVSYQHFHQMMTAHDRQSNTVRKFDHGSEEKNKEAYGTPQPPAYDLSLLHEKCTFWIGLEDPFTFKEDMEDFKKKTPNAEVEMIYIEGWGHYSGFLGPHGLLQEQIVGKIQEHLSSE